MRGKIEFHINLIFFVTNLIITSADADTKIDVAVSDVEPLHPSELHEHTSCVPPYPERVMHLFTWV